MQYRVKPGFTFGQFDQLPEGSLIELTEQEAASFLDKLELITPRVNDSPEDDTPSPEGVDPAGNQSKPRARKRK